jgi:hypothetical protein
VWASGPGRIHALVPRHGELRGSGWLLGCVGGYTNLFVKVGAGSTRLRNAKGLEFCKFYEYRRCAINSLIEGREENSQGDIYIK